MMDHAQERASCRFLVPFFGGYPVHNFGQALTVITLIRMCVCVCVHIRGVN